MSLRINSRGSQVVRLQKELKAAGFNPGPTDGIFGRGTQRAVRAYQSKYRLGVDGIVGPRTWSKLLHDGKTPAGGTSSVSRPSSAPRGRSVLGYVNGSPRRIQIAPVGNGKYLRADAAARFNQMKAAARRAGVNLSVVSGFRTMAQQRQLYAAYRAGRGNLAARPGYSNHQGGLSADLNTGGYNTRAYKWLKAHGRQYGFVNDVRGEHWHWTFRG
ncbi:MAG: D-alanyl-D-alanine carboxypeptidase family protein [Archangium sp.]|nr:D-alanyl-D-alanine carboxypeptidase family protein [Archangium sp.]